MKLVDKILFEVGNAREKEKIGSGVENVVYPIGSDKVVKASSSGNGFNHLINMINKAPDLFVKVYRYNDSTAVLQKVDTEEFVNDIYDIDNAFVYYPGDEFPCQDEYGVIEQIWDMVRRKEEDTIYDASDYLAARDAAVMEKFNKIVNYLTQMNERLGDEPIDIHYGQFGYDEKDNIKCFDT